MTSPSLAASLAAVVILVVVGGAPVDDKSGSDPATKFSPRPKKTTTKSTSKGTASTAAQNEKNTAAPARKTEKATFGAGCFWHVEYVFEHVRGVKAAVSGYAGGAVPYPSYEMVHTGETGHAEVVQVEFDPAVVSYEKLLGVFWSCHDPTSLNRQGEDEGPQYRSVIFYHNLDQKEAALKSYEELTRARAFPRPIVTELAPMRAFYRAEDYHQDYYGGKPRATTRRHRTVTPKVAKSKQNGARSARGMKSPGSSGSAPESSARESKPSTEPPAEPER